MTTKTIPSYVEVNDQKCGYIGYSRGNNLDEVYGTYSVAKSYAWRHCERLCDELDGRHLSITSNNTYIFTAQFEFNNPENGRPMVCHITPSRTYAMYLDMHHIDTARDSWREYAMIFANTTAWPDMQDLYDGVHVVWCGGAAHIIAHNELYRVDDALTSKYKLRKRVVLQFIGCYDDFNELMAAVADAAGAGVDR